MDKLEKIVKRLNSILNLGGEENYNITIISDKIKIKWYNPVKSKYETRSLVAKDAINIINTFYDLYGLKRENFK